MQTESEAAQSVIIAQGHADAAVAKAEVAAQEHLNNMQQAAEKHEEEMRILRDNNEAEMLIRMHLAEIAAKDQAAAACETESKDKTSKEESSNVVASMHELLKVIAAPREIIRGADGRATGMKVKS